ncbi:MAG: helix-turn-helix domain-containing protein [Tannerellaceae bacterium]|jgi:transcriptional regulator with XRE-family HTH domain|nr:helix-turn-helix domain-containing protein [Tannerellaceae bacterium]
MEVKAEMGTIGNRIKAIRLKSGATQTIFASKIGTTQSFLSSIEKDKAVPTEAMMDLLSLSYGVNKQWLLNGDGEIYSAGYIAEIDPSTASFDQKMNNIELLEQIIIYVEKYLIDSRKKATPAAKARFIAYFYKHFTKNDEINYDPKEVKRKILSAIDVLATVIGE